MVLGERGGRMKYTDFKCLKCCNSSSFRNWDDATKRFMKDTKWNMRLFKSIRECVGKYHRDYVCPSCNQVINMRHIKGEFSHLKKGRNYIHGIDYSNGKDLTVEVKGYREKDAVIITDVIVNESEGE